MIRAGGHIPGGDSAPCLSSSKVKSFTRLRVQKYEDRGPNLESPRIILSHIDSGSHSETNFTRFWFQPSEPGFRNAKITNRIANPNTLSSFVLHRGRILKQTLRVLVPNFGAGRQKYGDHDPNCEPEHSAGQDSTDPHLKFLENLARPKPR